MVDNFIDNLRADEKVAKRFTHAQARRMPTLKAEHGLGHWVEVQRGGESRHIAFDFGLTPESYNHNFLELGLEAGKVDAVALSHGHMDHYGGLGGFLFGTKEGTVPALSLIVSVEDMTGTDLYTGVGGIRLVVRVDGDRFVRLPRDSLFMDGSRNAAAIHLALDSLPPSLAAKQRP